MVTTQLLSFAVTQTLGHISGKLDPSTCPRTNHVVYFFVGYVRRNLTYEQRHSSEEHIGTFFNQVLAPSVHFLPTIYALKTFPATISTRATILHHIAPF